jgi:Xaa-Pro aminopeptidase
MVSFSSYINLKSGLNKFELIPTSGLVEQLRLIKSDEEIELLKKASEISDKALEATIPCIKPGITEIELLAQLEYNIKTNGADALSFDTMVLSGAKTSLLHGKADHKTIVKGDFILFDFGALYKGYHADISRTFVLGTPNEQQKEMYEIIQRAQENACKSIKPNISGNIPDSEVRNVIPEKYIKYYYPGLGHGVGLQIHEDPFIKNTSDFIFKENMTLTIEPGIYIPNFGGLRIEDTIVVTKTGCESLNKFPRDLICL